MATLKISPRYYRRHVAPGVEWKETNTGYANLDWEIPLDKSALMLVDVWEKHYLQDTMERADQIIRDRLAPLVAACRNGKMPVIHAPGPGVAEKQVNWVRMISEGEMEGSTDHWPPPEFRSKSGKFEAFARPDEPRQPELTELRKNRRLHPLIKIEDDEPARIRSRRRPRLHHRDGVVRNPRYAGSDARRHSLPRDVREVLGDVGGYHQGIIEIEDRVEPLSSISDSLLYRFEKYTELSMIKITK